MFENLPLPPPAARTGGSAIVATSGMVPFPWFPTEATCKTPTLEGNEGWEWDLGLGLEPEAGVDAQVTWFGNVAVGAGAGHDAVGVVMSCLSNSG